MKLKVVIAEDEPLALDRLMILLSKDPEIEVVSSCNNGLEAVRSLREHRPDVVFLDIKMPDLDGFGVIRELKDQSPPVVVFVTAYDQFAVKAFEVNAVDYLLKPFDASRLNVCLTRVKERFLGGTKDEVTARLEKVLEMMEQKTGGGYLERLLVKSQGRMTLVNVSEIDWVEAADNYMKLQTATGEHLIRETMSSLESRLDPRFFQRISRSILVNLQRIREMQPMFHGDSVLILQDGKRLTVSRNYRESLLRVLEGQ